MSAKSREVSLKDFWDVNSVSEDGLLFSQKRRGFILEADGLDGNFLTSEQRQTLHEDWRAALQFSPGEEIQLVFRKRVEFEQWVESQLQQSFLSDNIYGRKILLDRLADLVSEMSETEPRLLAQKIHICFWTDEKLDEIKLRERRNLFRNQIMAFGFKARALDRSQIEREINTAVQDLSSTENQQPEWPAISIEGGQLYLNSEDCFRALELTKLPESFTELGMIQSITSLPYPLDLSVRLKARDTKPIVSGLERKRNLLNAKKGNKSSPMPQLDSQIDQIDQLLKNLSDRSEFIFDLKLTVGLRFPKKYAGFQRKALAKIMRSASQMDFCEIEEVTLSVFDSFLECVPGFTGKNIRSHTLLGSNAIHFLPFFRPSQGDRRAIASFQTRSAGLYNLDPVDQRLANYNWLVSGTSGAGKSFFVNSLVAQSVCLSPNVFIVDIGGSYNKLTQYLGGRVVSLNTKQGFELSPFFLPKNSSPTEERMRRQHIFQIFLEMTRLDGKLPSIESRHILSESLEELFDNNDIPDLPITTITDKISKLDTEDSRHLSFLLQPWCRKHYFGQFLDNNKTVLPSENILTFDLKDLTQFSDLARVVQLIVCACLWARVRENKDKRFSWFILDEVAFSLLKTQPQFVDELVSTLRKYFGGAIIVVQDLEKITSNLAGSSILQNTQSKAILQQRGNPQNYSDVLSLTTVDQWAIQSLRREKGYYSDIFLIRDNDKTVIRHVPSTLEYWLSTTAPEDNHVFTEWMEGATGSFQKKINDFVNNQKKEVS